MKPSARFDPADYRANPGKYRLFTSAAIASHVFTHNGENDLEAGAVVRIEYAGELVNRLYNRVEPIYTVDGLPGFMFASRLADFVI